MKTPSLVAVLSVTLTLLSGTATAAPGTRLSVVGAAGYGLNRAGNPALISIRGGWGFGGGALVNFGIGGNSLELGALYLSRKFETSVSGSASSSETASLHLPLLLRIGGTLSLGIGGFYDLSLEDDGRNNFGVAAGPRLSVPGGLFVDARFNYGLRENMFILETSKEVLLLLGYQF